LPAGAANREFIPEIPMMTFLRKLFARNSSPKRRTEPRRACLQLEALEERQVMSVTFHGGKTLPNVEVNAIFYGSGWENDPTGQASYAEQHTQQFLGDIVQSPYMDMLGNAGYGVGHGSSSSENIWVPNLDTTQYLTDASLQKTLQYWIDHQEVPDADQNRLYAIFVQPNMAVQMADGQTSVSNFFGYHRAFAGHDSSGGPLNVRYAVIAYPGGTVPLSSGTAHNGTVSWLGTTDQLTEVTSHEIAEAVTDPDGSAWYEGATEQEVGDLANLQTVYVDGYAVQRIADPGDQPMTPADATSNRPVTFVLQETDRYVPGLWGSGWTTTNELYERTPDGKLSPVTVNGSVAWNVRSISDQGIDNHGFAMIDVVFNDNTAWEYHDDGSSNPLGFGVVKDAKAGQGVSYILHTDGTFSELKDTTYGFTDLTPWWFNINAQSIDAGTDHRGVNLLVIDGSPQTWELSDDYAWYFVGNNILQVSAGRQGNLCFIDSNGDGWFWAAEVQPGSWGDFGSGVSKLAVGYNTDGSLVIDALFSNSNLMDYRYYGGGNWNWQQMDSGVTNVSKARAGIVDDVESGGNALEFTAPGDYVFAELASGDIYVGRTYAVEVG
jgi:hypothetical protein